MAGTLIKICGITRPADGLAAIEAGADWLGFIRWPRSARFRPLAECARTLEAIRAAASRPFQAVGVFVDPGHDLIEEELRAARFDRIQLHGRETLEFVRAIAVPIIKAIKIEGPESLALADEYPDLDILTDTPDPRMPGGTGRGYDLSLLEGIVRRRRVIVAGGLHPGNVGEVVNSLSPYGVDVSSGVEDSPGVKNAAKVRAFIEAVSREDTSSTFAG